MKDLHPIENSRRVAPLEAINDVFGRLASILANVNDDALRAELIRKACELQFEAAIAIGAKPLDPDLPTEVTIALGVEYMTEYVDSLRPLYDVFDKAEKAGNN